MGGGVVEVQSHIYCDIYRISETKVESEDECCDRKCGIHIISFQVQERGTYFPSLQEMYPYAINKYVNIVCHLETPVCCYAFRWCHSVLGSN